jgi:hypothetical protein
MESTSSPTERSKALAFVNALSITSARAVTAFANRSFIAFDSSRINFQIKSWRDKRNPKNIEKNIYVSRLLRDNKKEKKKENILSGIYHGRETRISTE